MKRKLILVGVPVFFCANLAAATLTEAMTLQPDDGKDAWIQSSPEGQFENYGTAPHLITRSEPFANVGLLAFDLSGYPGLPVKNAFLSLYLTGESGQQGLVGIYQIVDPWEENTVRWVNRPGLNADPVAVRTLDPGDGNSFITFDVTELARAWVTGTSENHGVYVGLMDAGGTPLAPDAYLHSSDFKNGPDGLLFDPKLDISPVPIPGSFWLAAGGLLGILKTRRKGGNPA